ncbi:hypothetical protein [Sphingopyxis sp. 113P3]|uniref:hypothetical protein n=1 Tax=Sphingopyxis sp. (strain 113P3) TaxID=292913 RepID=UPI0006BD7124|nr:hypothetical protein [Sphingopyxis sp. 113P3]ALC10351.1 hypothetical protein LH20_00100 [Sphingopyxis sp. 113P3]
MTRVQRGAAVRAWLIAGTLDIAYAAGLTLMAGGSVGGMLRGVASGPFQSASGWGPVGAVAGLGVHFAIMAAMVAAWFSAVHRWPALADLSWWIGGTLYGLLLYLVMNAIVLPLRFGSPFPPEDLANAALLLLPHVLLVGWPIAWLARNKETPRC